MIHCPAASYQSKGKKCNICIDELLFSVFILKANKKDRMLYFCIVTLGNNAKSRIIHIRN